MTTKITKGEKKMKKVRSGGQEVGAEIETKKLFLSGGDGRR